MSYDFKGESRQFVQEGNTLAVTFAFALLLIYLVLAAQFESFRDPFIILIGLPATVFGALFVLFDARRRQRHDAEQSAVQSSARAPSTSIPRSAS